ncbi:MAG: hypothetical protein QGG42_01010 [Phycisphaerae bacterium]|jgi:hypothetical protein|nr:hypothetical protein [Phycisphaerae bacterium]
MNKRNVIPVGSFSVCLVCVLLTQGCGAELWTRKTDAVGFLHLYMGQAPPGQSEMGWFAQYAGRKDDRHYLDVRYSNFGNPLKCILFGDDEKRYSCPSDELPEGFPEDLGAEELVSRRAEWILRPENLNNAIRKYLARGGKLTDKARRRLGPEVPQRGSVKSGEHSTANRKLTTLK